MALRAVITMSVRRVVTGVMMDVQPVVTSQLLHRSQQTTVVTVYVVLLNIQQSVLLTVEKKQEEDQEAAADVKLGQVRTIVRRQDAPGVPTVAIATLLPDHKQIFGQLFGEHSLLSLVGKTSQCLLCVLDCVLDFVWCWLAVERHVLRREVQRHLD